MPVLHKYKAKDAYYVLTSVNNSIITFHLTDEGFRKLNSSGVAAGDRFGRALLFDLYRSGDAFTHGSGIGTTEINIDERQLALDFPNDPEPESMFPVCSSCASLSDLHLVEIKGESPSASIYCAECRARKSSEIDSSVPLPLISRTFIGRLFEMKGIQSVDTSIQTYQKLLEAEFASKWEAVLKAKSVKQGRLLDVNGDQQGSLL